MQESAARINRRPCPRRRRFFGATLKSTSVVLLFTTSANPAIVQANEAAAPAPQAIFFSSAQKSFLPSMSLKQSPLSRNKRHRRWNVWLLSDVKRGGATPSSPPTLPNDNSKAEAAGNLASSSPQNQSVSSNPQSASTSRHPKEVSPESTQQQSKEIQEKKEGVIEEDKEEKRIKMLIRVLFLVYYGSLGSLMPYLPVYYHSLGHGGQIIGLLGAVKPFTTFLVAPVWGAISDQTHNPFFILQLTFLVSLVGQLLVGVRHEFSYIMCMVFLTALFNAPVKSLLDSMVLDHLQHRSQYGRLRLWGQLGFGLGSSGVGYLLSKSKHVSWSDTAAFSPSFEGSLARYPVALQTAFRYANKCWQSMTGYKLLFMAYASLSVPTWICIKAFERLDREAKEAKNSVSSDPVAGKNAEDEDSKQKNASNINNATKKHHDDEQVADTSVWHGLSLVLQNPDALLFFFLVLAVGVSSGLIENFAYVRIREVGGTGKEMGISRLISSLAGAPMFWFSGPLSKRFGVDRVLVISLLSYVTRFVIYASMSNPYHGLPAEALRGVTFAAFWSSATIYAHKVSPPGLHATMLMLVNAMYGGLGQSLGAVFGGKLQHKFGTVKTFWYAAASDLCLVAAVIAYLMVRSNSSFRDPKPIEYRRQKQQLQPQEKDEKQREKDSGDTE